MILKFQGKEPKISDKAFIMDNVTIIGDVQIEEKASIWFGTVLRGDAQSIKIGANTNVQDNVCVHVGFDVSTTIGNNVTIGHNAVIHGCKIADNCLIGMGAIILNNAEIGENTIVGAGSLVTEGKKIPSGVLCLGSPAKVVRELTKEEIESISKSAQSYVELAQGYM